MDSAWLRNIYMYIERTHTPDGCMFPPFCLFIFLYLINYNEGKVVQRAECGLAPVTVPLAGAAGSFSREGSLRLPHR